MKKISVFIILLIISPMSSFSSNVLDSLKQARAENFNKSFIENAYRKVLSRNTDKINGISYIEINIDSSYHIKTCYVVDSLTTITDKVFLSNLLKEFDGKKMSVYNGGGSLAQGENNKTIIYRAQIDWSTLKSVAQYKGRSQNSVRSAIKNMSRKISNIYAASLKQLDYEGIINLKISINEKGDVVKYSLNEVNDLNSANHLILKLNSFFESAKFDSLDGGSEILNHNIYLRFKKSWFPEYSNDTITIPIAMTEEREDSVTNFIKHEYSKDFGRIPPRGSSIYVLSNFDRLEQCLYDSIINLHFTNRFNDRFIYTKSNGSGDDSVLIKWHMKNINNYSKIKYLKSIGKYDYLLIISFQYIAYPANITSFSSANFGFSIVSDIVGGSFSSSPSDFMFEYGYGTAVIAGIKLTFYNLKTGKVICEKGDYNDSSFEGVESNIKKEVLYNIDEVLEDITFY